MENITGLQTLIVQQLQTTLQVMFMSGLTKLILHQVQVSTIQDNHKSWVVLIILLTKLLML